MQKLLSEKCSGDLYSDEPGSVEIGGSKYRITVTDRDLFLDFLTNMQRSQ